MCLVVCVCVCSVMVFVQPSAWVQFSSSPFVLRHVVHWIQDEGYSLMSGEIGDHFHSR